MFRPHSTVRRHRKVLLRLSENKCHYCQDVAQTADHVIPKADGGGDERSNLVACCSNCNEGKGCELSYAVFSRYVRRFGTPPKGWRDTTNKVMLLRLDDLHASSGSSDVSKTARRMLGPARIHLLDRYRRNVRRSIESLFVPGGARYALMFSSPHGLAA